MSRGCAAVALCFNELQRARNEAKYKRSPMDNPAEFLLRDVLPCYVLDNIEGLELKSGHVSILSDSSSLRIENRTRTGGS